MTTPPPRPTPTELAAAQDRTIPDVTGPGLRVLFCGINPGLWSGATGHHFARPGNRFWPALHRSGFTPRQLAPHEQDQLPALGLGITNVVARASAKADELSREELRAGGEALRERVAGLRPRVLAVLGIGAYRTAFGQPKAVIGRQAERLGDTEVWALPNPSGLNAHYTLDALADEFRTLREAVER
ncbi:G/U mismatch-specific DNA glycosylase [Kitasatospora acidiphila]|uniref:G/U mismatch-specific DNA glycosylase n=1 Tax=Kitasatospora acidiphila TaxID=2567942 RepID=A0A540W7F4_9ACTN|nr:G/U mismatch-specific DNA glycosylase [Kitasatospora acidiphila]TQF04960.1 G/U mismatch-specific DNA glycosylase [Kitasatospora acidiphila]